MPQLPPNKRSKDRLIEQDIKELKIIWKQNKPYCYDILARWRDPKFGGDRDTADISTGLRLSTNTPQFRKWMQIRFDLKPEFFSSTLNWHNTPNTPHADIIYNVPNHITQHVPCTTSYILLETDSKVGMKTAIFDQYVDPATYEGGLVKAYKENQLKYPGTVPIGNTVSGLEHIPDFIQPIPLTLQKFVETPLWELVSWPSDQVHCGASFEMCQCTYKWYISIIRTTEDFEKWYNS